MFVGLDIGTSSVKAVLLDENQSHDRLGHIRI
jgi:sugar (pentulose or hexulose) kinase